MRRVDLMSKTTTLVTMLSIVYALIDMKIIFLAPILTISIPYRFMKYKEEGKHTENRKILNNLLLFNLIVFIGVTAITNRMSTDIFEIIVNIIITFIYFKVLSMIDKKRETLYNNPQMVNDKINERSCVSMNSIFSKKLKKKRLHMIRCQVYHIQNGIANIMLYYR